MRISEVVDRMHLTVASADGQVGGELRGRYDVTFWIADGQLARVGEDRVGQQLAEVARELIRERAQVIGRAKAYTGALASRAHRAAQDAAFREQVAQAAVEARSADGLVGVRALGVQHIAFDVRPGAPDDAAVARSATDAARTAAGALVGEVRRIQREVYAAGG